MIGLLITILILLLIFGVIIYIVGLIPLPAPWQQIAYAIVALIFILVLLKFLVGFPGTESLFR